MQKGLAAVLLLDGDYGRIPAMRKHGNTLVVGRPTASTTDGWYRLGAALRVEGDAQLEAHQANIWFSLPAEHADAFTLQDCSDCFLLGVLYFAMRNGYDIRLEGAVSAQLAAHLQDEVMPIMCAYRPCLRPIRVSAAEMLDFQGGSGVGTGFSGGVDSFHTIYSNLQEPGHPHDKITHLFFFNVGTNGLGRSAEEVALVRTKFLRRYEALRTAADMIGLPLIPVDSNVHSFLPDNIASDITICNAAAIHFLRGGIGLYLTSSNGYDYEALLNYLMYTRPSTRIDMAMIEHVLCQWLSDGTLRIVPYGTNKKRLEKTQAIADYRPAQLRLNVCNSVSTLEKNCSVCSKCRRSMLELELLGKLDLFGEAFDIDTYRKKFKSRDFAELLYPPPEYKNPFLHDARRYAMAHGIDIGSHCTAMDRICAYMHQTWIYRFLKALSLLGVVKRILGRK